MKRKILLGLAFVLSGGLVGCERVSVSDIKITCSNAPAAPSWRYPQLPGEALYPRGMDSIEHGALTNIVAGRIAGLTVTWADTNLFKTESQIQDFLRELLSSPNTQTWTFHIWSYVDGVPSMVVMVEHTAGKQGKWIIWNSPNVAWAYQDGSGKWWWGMWDVLKTPKPKSLAAGKQP